MEQHKIRDSLFNNHRKNVFKCLPEAEAACREALEQVTKYLCNRYPFMFQKDQLNTGERLVRVTETDEKFDLSPRSKMEPVEIAARLSMEDLSILLENENGIYYLYVELSECTVILMWHPC